MTKKSPLAVVRNSEHQEDAPAEHSPKEMERIQKSIEELEKLKFKLLNPSSVTVPETMRKCPHCGKVGKVRDVFGTKVVDGITRANSWCTECRGTKDAHPTKNGLGRRNRRLSHKCPTCRKKTVESEGQFCSMECMKNA